MARPPRTELAGGIHHVTARGNRKHAIFRDERDQLFFLRELAAAARRFNWTCLTYCLMANHCHLIVETHDETLGIGMQQLTSNHAQMYNSRHGTGGGHVFQGRFWSKLIRSDTYFAQVLRYVALNPVVAGLCTEPADWRWSGHRALLGIGAADAPVARARVESLLSTWGGSPGARYTHLFDPTGPLAVRFGAESPWEHRLPLAELLATDDLDGAMRAAHDHGYRLREIADAVGLHTSNVSRRIRAERKLRV